MMMTMRAVMKMITIEENENGAEAKRRKGVLTQKTEQQFTVLHQLIAAEKETKEEEKIAIMTMIYRRLLLLPLLLHLLLQDLTLHLLHLHLPLLLTPLCGKKYLLLVMSASYPALELSSQRQQELKSLPTGRTSAKLSIESRNRRLSGKQSMR